MLKSPPDLEFILKLGKRRRILEEKDPANG